MANYYGNKNWNGKKNYNGKKKKSKYTEVEKLAYKFGQVQRGINNPNSLIHESYQNGLKEKESKPKKPLF